MTWKIGQQVTFDYTGDTSDTSESVLDSSFGEAPRFVNRQKSQSLFSNQTSDESTLQVDEKVDSRLTPIVLDCTLYPWEIVLPPIFNETFDNKVNIEVDLGSTSRFLTYSSYERRFELLQSDVPEKRNTWTVVIDLANQYS